MIQFELVDTDGFARRGRVKTTHGVVESPAFMPVGTQGTVKGVTADQLRGTGAQMVLGNTYHLTLRPGEEVVAQLGGLHTMMGWQGPILTDSGGFQVFSLAKCNKVTEEGANFQSHIDGSSMLLTPERAVAIQEALGSDIAMVLDHVVALPNSREVVEDALQRSIRWAERCLESADHEYQSLFAIVQGGLEPDLRIQCAEALVDLNFPGYAIGGLSVGEPPPQMYEILDITCPVLPDDKPRYLMGVGRPEDLLEGVKRGVDLFDCVMPTRNGRNALAFTDEGKIKLRNLKHQKDLAPIDPACPCPACRHSRGYIRHLFMAGEMLGPILVSLHNLTYYQRLMSDAREAIERHEFERFYSEKMSSWSP